MLCAALNKSYYHSTSSVPLAHVTTKDMLDYVVQRTPDKEAYVFPLEKVRLTFAELKRQVDALGTKFICIGLRRGDILGILSSCAPDYILVQHAAAQIGVILARLNIGMPNSTLQTAILKSECVALLVGADDDNVHKQIMQIIPDLKTTASEILQVRDKSKLRLLFTNLAGSQDRWNSKDNTNIGKIDPSNSKQLLEETSKCVEFGDLYTILYTSGSTGPIKGTLHSQASHQNLYMMCADRYGWTNDDVLLATCTSLSHGSSEMFLIAPLILGMTSVILSPGANIEDNVALIQHERCTALFATYPSLNNLLHHGNTNQYDCSSLRYIVTSAAAIPQDFIKKINKLFHAKVLNTYGSSEALFISGRDLIASENEVIDKVGRPFGHTEVKIVNENGGIVPINTLGELLVRSNFLFYSYINDEDKTRQVKSVDGWYRSGDIAKINNNGYITIVGRRQDIIMKGGQTMYYSSLVESLLSHPNVKAAYIVPVPDEELQEDFCACVSLIGDIPLSGHELKKFYSSNISMDIHVPKHVMVFDHFPKTSTGKIDPKSLSLEVFEKLSLDKDWLVHGRQTYS
ncbi:medium-chain acyl-CoA ligase ACSF2, mitochondrial-like [Saccoglossus kowalevskii]|uniref:Acyl-CoA synthetase family member 2, mitochondrial-like n=1 Tax=Saccoglossus kowalevskii TaxID=10224 RepID=A0ABM0GLY6_SACKO|nr:PREDICTED: acyl-CoA synthetase family member 2, mitochondrial-like [Saccoglossus kowalevskii]